MAVRYNDKQWQIPDDPPIREEDLTGAYGASAVDLIGRTVVTAYNVPDSDGCVLLLLDNGEVIGFDVDIGYTGPPDYARDPNKHEVFMMNATDTDAGRMIKQLDPGEWL